MKPKKRVLKVYRSMEKQKTLNSQHKVFSPTDINIDINTSEQDLDSSRSDKSTSRPFTNFDIENEDQDIAIRKQKR